MTLSIALPDGLDSAAQDAAMRRAYTWARMLDYGVCIDDAFALHREGSDPLDWVRTTLAMGDTHVARAAAAREAGLHAAASQSERHGAAAYRLCQSALEEHADLRARVYQSHSDAFSRAMRDEPVRAAHVTRLALEHERRPLAAWFFEASKGAPTVIVFGGADGWCEAFEPSVAAFAQRGLSVCLIELPGQGLAGLRHGSSMKEDFWRAVSACIDLLEARGITSFGVTGHSMGGTLAMIAAAHEPRISACCSNGGSAFLARGLQRYPRVLQKVARMTALPPDGALALVEAMQARHCAEQMQARLLVLHGDLDVLVDMADIEQLPARTSGGAVTVRRWAKGEHCVYSAAQERNAVMTDWFRSVLTPG